MNEIDSFKELKNSIMEFIEMLDVNGLELNDDGDIVEKTSKKLIWNIINNKDDENE